MKKKIPFLLLFIVLLAGCGGKTSIADTIKNNFSKEVKESLADKELFVSDENLKEIDIVVYLKAPEDFPKAAEELTVIAKNLAKPVRSIILSSEDDAGNVYNWTSFDCEQGALIGGDGLVDLDVDGLYEYFGVQK